MSSIFDLYSEVDDTVARLDERLAHDQLGAAVAERVLYAETCAAMKAAGCLVHAEDLVLFDGHAYAGPASVDLSTAYQTLRIWKRGLALDRSDVNDLLMSPRPGEISVDVTAVSDARLLSGIAHEPRLMETYRDTLAQSGKLPPLLAAAMIWDCWRTLSGGTADGWRAALLAALVLKARGKTASYLLPLAAGKAKAKAKAPWRSKDEAVARIRCFLVAAKSAAHQIRSELSLVTVAGRVLRQRAAAVTKRSKLPGLVGLLLEKPFVSSTMAARALRCSRQAVERMMQKLGSLPRELTGRRRYRVWGL